MNGGNGKDVHAHTRTFEGPPPEDEAERPEVPAKLPELAEFLSMEFPLREKLLGPFYSESIAHCVSKTGVGKTNFATAMAIALKYGRGLFHWECPKPRRVLLVDGEMPGSMLQDRLKQYATPPGGAELLIMNAMSWAAQHGLGRPNMADPFWQAQFLKWGEGSEFMIFDNVMSLVSMPGESLSSDTFWKPVNDFNLNVRQAGKAILWCDHANSIGQTFGTKTKEWHADLVLKLSHPRDDDESEWDSFSDGCEFELRFDKKRGLHGDDVAPVHAKLIAGRHGEVVWSHALLEDEKIVTACKLKENGMSIREIAAEMKVGKSTIARWIAKAES